MEKNLWYLDEGPSRWGSCGEEVEVNDLTTSDSETDEDDDYNKEGDDDDFIDDEYEEDDEDSDDDDEPDINYFLMGMKVASTYSLRGRALCEWDPEYRYGF